MNSVALFGLGLSGEAVPVTALALASPPATPHAAEPSLGKAALRVAASRAASGTTKRVALAEPAPLPPARPLELHTAAASAPQGAEEPAREPSRILGWRVPTGFLSSGRQVFDKVASLGDAVIERLTP